MNTEKLAVTGEGNAPRVEGLVYDTVREIADACDSAKYATLWDARKHFSDSKMLFSFPNPYMLAMNGEGRMNPEPVFFRRVPSKRDILNMAADYPNADYIAAYFDLHAGTMEERMNGEMDEPTDFDAEVILYRKEV